MVFLPEKVVRPIILGGISSSISLGAAVGAFGLIFHLGWRYHAFPLSQFIARLPGVRLILYVHQK